MKFQEPKGFSGHPLCFYSHSEETNMFHWPPSVLLFGTSLLACSSASGRMAGVFLFSLHLPVGRLLAWLQQPFVNLQISNLELLLAAEGKMCGLKCCRRLLPALRAPYKSIRGQYGNVIAGLR